MKRVFLGTGLIGGGLAQAAAQRGDEVVVWNRTRSKAEALTEFGAEVAADAPTAVAGVRHVHLALTSDAAVDAVLESIMDALEEDAVVIDHSTTSPGGTLARAEKMAAAGKRYLHVPVFMSPEACKAAKGIMLVAGPEPLYQEQLSAIEPMTGRVRWCGEKKDAAATLKLVGNCMLLAMVGGLADAFAIASSNGLGSEDVMGLFADWNPGYMLQGRGARMAEGDFETLWTLTMARKDLGLMKDTAGDDAGLAVLPGLGARMDGVIAEGEGERDVAVLARDSLNAGKTGK